MATDFFKIGQASGAQAPDITGSFLEGLEAGLKPFAELEEKRKKADDLTKKYISAIPNVDAINKIPDWMRSDVTSYLASEKKLYADTAKQLAEMDSSDPAYMETLDKLQSIQNNFITLNDQLNQFQEDSKEYFEASDNGNISKGFTVGEAEKYNNTASVFSGAGKLNIQNGQLVFNVGGKNLNYSNGEVGDFYSPDFEVQSGIDGIAALVENDGLKGLQFNENGYARRIQTLLQQGGKERLLSLVYDDDPRFTTAQGLQTPQIMAAINAGELGVARSLIADELMQGIRTTHGNFLRQYNQALEESKGKEESSYGQALSLYNQLKQNPIGYFETYTGVAPVWDRKTNIVEIYEGGELQFKYDLNNPAQRGGFYKQLLDASDYLKGTSAKEEETRRIFDMLVMSGARGSSSTTPGPNTKLDNSKKPTAPPTIEERADQAFNTKGFSTEPLSIPADLTRNEKFFINELSKTKADITEQDIAEAVYNSSGRQIITIFGKEYKPKALYEKDVKLQSKDQENFKNLFEASSERAPIAIRDKYLDIIKDNDYLKKLNIKDISQLTYKDIEKIKLLEKNISLGDIDIAEKQEKFKSKKIT